MSRVSFKTVNTTTISTLQTAIDTVFAFNYEQDALTKEAKRLKKEYDALENPTDDDKSALDKALNVITYKRSALRTWYADRMESDGMYYDALGVRAMVDAQELGSRDKNVKAVKDVLSEVYGFNTSVDKRVVKLAAIVTDAISGLAKGTRTQILKGQLTRDRKARELYETALLTVAEYAEKSVPATLVVKTKEFYAVTINYKKDSLEVEGYEIKESENN